MTTTPNPVTGVLVARTEPLPAAEVANLLQLLPDIDARSLTA